MLGGSAALSGFAAVLLLAAPFSLAHGTVTFAAPFTGFGLSSSNYTYASTCASESQTVLPTWTSANGTFQIASSVAAGGCRGSQIAEAYASIDLVSPVFTPPAAGFGYVYATLSSAFSAQASLHLAAPTNGSFGYGYTSVSLIVAIYVYDMTHNNVSLFGYGSDVLASQTFSSSGAYSLHMGWTNSTIYATGTFAAFHHYQLQLDISALIYSDTYGGGSSGRASLNVGGTNGIAISSIVVA
ncbi:MAG: hypothetical protein L3J73_04005 [Thermoplasmata archaeon]|nr:hypothetical protein [Thermoplasmata archaeon]